MSKARGAKGEHRAPCNLTIRTFKSGRKALGRSIEGHQVEKVTKAFGVGGVLSRANMSSGLRIVTHEGVWLRKGGSSGDIGHTD